MLLPSSCVYSRPLTTSLLKKGDGPNAESLKSEFFFFWLTAPCWACPTLSCSVCVHCLKSYGLVGNLLGNLCSYPSSLTYKVGDLGLLYLCSFSFLIYKMG